MDIHAAFAAAQKNPIKMKPRQALQEVSQPQHAEPKPSTIEDETNIAPAVSQAPDVSAEPAPPLADEPKAKSDEPEQVAVEESKPKATKPAFSPVDISIAGTHHRIVCPSDEVAHLESAVSFINEKVRSIRQDIKGKVPTNEELLVLTCLEMYDQIKALQDSEDYYTSERDDALNLIDKLLKSARAN